MEERWAFNPAATVQFCLGSLNGHNAPVELRSLINFVARFNSWVPDQMIKQVIVIRKDLKMRRGKEIAQGAHASMKWLVDRLIDHGHNIDDGHLKSSPSYKCMMPAWISIEEIQWLNGSFAKICLQVNSEKELMEIHNAAKNANLTVSLITDAGHTEFHGEPTVTCLAIGPHEESKIDPITSELKLY